MTMPLFEMSNRVSWGDGITCSWAVLLKEMEAYLAHWATELIGSRYLFVVQNAHEALGAIVYGLANRMDFGVIEQDRLSAEVAARLDEHGVSRMWLSEKRYEKAESGTILPERVTVLTSGTTGLLKLIPHTWKTLNTFDRVANLPVNTWFIPYQIGSYAWYQMISLGLFKAGQHLVMGDSRDLVGSFAAGLTGEITAISATPTFWRYVLMNLDLSELKAGQLRTISLGGEIVDQAILDNLQKIYPEAKIRHIFASSEAGASIVVTDGRAGFPVSLLTPREGATISIKIEEGLLHIRSPYSTLSAEKGRLDWVNTGDLVEIRDDRCVIIGRASNTMINVGGMKAFPSDIEAYLQPHPDVLWAHVYAQRAPLVGYLAAAKVVLRNPMGADKAERMLSQYCVEGLAEHAVPRFWEFLENIPLRGSLKS